MIPTESINQKLTTAIETALLINNWARMALGIDHVQSGQQVFDQ